MQVHGRKPTTNGGYSLLELMIVLAILVSVMAVAWPSIARRMQLIGPREAALQLKADLAEARERAIHSGEAWALRIEQGAANYEFGPVQRFRDELLRQSIMPSGVPGGTVETLPWSAPQISQPITGATEVGGTSNLEVTESSSMRTNVLPHGIVFDDGFAHRVSDANIVKAPAPPALATPTNDFEPLAAPPQEAHWKFAAVFQPNGRATEAEIRLQELSSENTIRLRIRRLTGGVSIDKLQRKPKTMSPPTDDVLLQEQAVPNQQSKSIDGSPQGLTDIRPSQVAPHELERR
jgi:prepilin-type N-terminal cleavage/methylation domain-containing protein